jgi:hypothetical protein
MPARSLKTHAREHYATASRGNIKRAYNSWIAAKMQKAAFSRNDIFTYTSCKMGNIKPDIYYIKFA